MREWKGRIIETYEEKHPLPKDDRRPWYRKHGLKRTVGATLLAAATALIAGGQVLVGAGVGALGGLVEGLGLFDAKKKQSSGEANKGDTLGTALLAWFRATVQLVKLIMKKRKEKQND
jgi:hypothetical protein